MGNVLSIEELKVIPYFNASAWRPDRYLNYPFMFFVKGEWHSWVAVGPKLQKMYMWPGESSYFGDAPERPTDQCYRLFNLLQKRASYPEMHRASRGIWTDFQNFATSLAKINLFFETSKQNKSIQTSRFVQTEIEYVVMVARGVYDLLQEIIGIHWKRIELMEKPKHKRDLPKSFADVVLHGDRPRTLEEIEEKWGLPKFLAEWYVAETDFFFWLRSLRNRLAHGGNDAVESIFTTERGFALSRREKPWCELYDWPVECELPNQLVPVRPVVATIIWSTIIATETFTQNLTKYIKFPDEIYPGLNYYSRGFHDQELAELHHVIDGSAWCDTRLKMEPFDDKTSRGEATL
jgi:hypothetical protein